MIRVTLSARRVYKTHSSSADIIIDKVSFLIKKVPLNSAVYLMGSNSYYVYSRPALVGYVVVVMDH